MNYFTQTTIWKKLVMAFAVLWPVHEICAQQQWGYSQYLFNLYDINGAYAGNHNSLSMCLRYRKQWVGFKDAPETQLISIHTPLLKNRMGAGLQFLHEKIGARSINQFKGTLAYKLKFGKAGLSFALSGGLIIQEWNMSELSVYDTNDPLLSEGIWRSTVPVVDVSAFLSSDVVFAGVESGSINRNKLNWTENSQARLFYHITAVAGVLKKISTNDVIQWSVLGKLAEGNVRQVESNLSFLWNNKVWVGAGYRFGYGVIMFTEWNMSSKLRLGYSFDLALSPLADYQSGSHEIFVGFNLQKNQHQSIRYF